MPKIVNARKSKKKFMTYLQIGHRLYCYADSRPHLVLQKLLSHASHRIYLDIASACW